MQQLQQLLFFTARLSEPVNVKMVPSAVIVSFGPRVLRETSPRRLGGSNSDSKNSSNAHGFLSAPLQANRYTHGPASAMVYSIRVGATLGFGAQQGTTQ